MKKIKLAIVTPYPPSVVTLNEYAYHLIQHFSQKEEITEIVLITDKVTDGNPEDHLPETGCAIRVRQTWEFNSMKNILNIWRTVRQEKPDVVLFNLQFLSFGDKKIQAALGLLTPWILKKSGFPSVVLLHNIMEEVDLSQAGITQNKLLTRIFNFIGSTLTRFLLASELVGVTIEKYVDVLREKYKKQNIALIPHGTFELPEVPDFSPSKGPLQIMTFGKFGTYKKVEILIEA
ncbi:MAG: glycosyl transferase family 1, partial [Saprospiraceae bacterium]|nr:glycosyl transferase family 1 [Saprospiraceae bacterium]